MEIANLDFVHPALEEELAPGCNVIIRSFPPTRNNSTENVRTECLPADRFYLRLQVFTIAQLNTTIH